MRSPSSRRSRPRRRSRSRTRAFSKSCTRATADLTDALERQTATADVLRVIASSPAALDRVFDALAERAVQLCDGAGGAAHRVDGDVLRLVAFVGSAREATIAVGTTRAITRRHRAGRAVLEGRVVHVEDVGSEQSLLEFRREPAKADGERGLASWLYDRGTDAARRRCHRRHHCEQGRATAFSDAADRLAGDVRRPGGHRDRERPAVPGAGAAQSRELGEALEQQTATAESCG